LLFITNLVGMTLAAAVTFIILGYAPIQRAKKGLLYTSIILATVTVPLMLSFSKLIEQNSIARMIESHYSINHKEIGINVLEIDLHNPKPIIKLESYTQEVLHKEDLVELKNEIEQSLKKSVELRVETKVIVR